MFLRRALVVVCFAAWGVGGVSAQAVPDISGTWEATGVVSFDRLRTQGSHGYSRPVTETLVITQTDRELVLEFRQNGKTSRKKYRLGVRNAKAVVEYGTIAIYDTASTNKSEDLYWREMSTLDQPSGLGIVFESPAQMGPRTRTLIDAAPQRSRVVYSVNAEGFTLEVEVQTGRGFSRYVYRRVAPGVAITR
jgi:hypothetical protein